MIEKIAASYFAIVKDEIGSRLLPALASSGSPEQIASLCQLILAELVTDARALPGLRATALNGYAEAVPALKLLLDDADGRADLAALEAALNGAREYHQVTRLIQKISQKLAGQSHLPAVRDVIKTLVGIEATLYSDFLTAYQEETARSSVDTTTKEALSTAQITQLAAWIAEQFPGNDGVEITGLKLVPGGFSKHTIFVHLSGAKTLPETVVVRLDWANSAVGTTVVDEFRIIQTLFNAGVKVPQPYAMEPTGAVLGGPFLLVSKAEGSNLGDALTVRGGTLAFAQDLARTLAKLHAVPASSFDDSVDGAHESVRDRILREIAKFEADWRALDEPSPALETAFVWLRQNVDLADGPRCLIHKDVGCHNMLAKDDQVSVLLDWETAAIGTAAQDLGYAHPSVIQMCDWEDFIAAYVEAGGVAPTQAQVDYYTLWGFTWTYTMVLQTRAILASGVNDVRVAFAATYLLSRTGARLREKLYSII